MKKEERIHIDFAANKNCYATAWSYGEICVGCECCSKDKKVRRAARREYWKEILHENENFDNWIEGFEDLQKRNVSSNIKYAKKMIKKYSDFGVKPVERGNTITN